MASEVLTRVRCPIFDQMWIQSKRDQKTALPILIFRRLRLWTMHPSVWIERLMSSFTADRIPREPEEVAEAITGATARSFWGIQSNLYDGNCLRGHKQPLWRQPLQLSAAYTELEVGFHVNEGHSRAMAVSLSITRPIRHPGLVCPPAWLFQGIVWQRQASPVHDGENTVTLTAIARRPSLPRCDGTSLNNQTSYGSRKARSPTRRNGTNYLAAGMICLRIRYKTRFHPYQWAGFFVGISIF